MGFEYRKPNGLPRVASAEKQAEFIALYERLLNGLGADKAVYFGDAVQPEYQTKPSYGWVNIPWKLLHVSDDFSQTDFLPVS